MLRGTVDTAPIEYTDYLLIKNLYRCTPLELDEQPFDTVALHLAFMNLEAKEGELKQKRQAQKVKVGRFAKK